MALTPPDPETVGLAAKVAGFFATMGATAFGILKVIDRKIERKAEADTVKDHTSSIAELYANAREDKTELRSLVEDRSNAINRGITRLEETARMDRQDILAGIQRLADQTGTFQREVFVALGERPTRDQITEMVEDKIRAARSA